jgi:hypothetical protein
MSPATKTKPEAPVESEAPDFPAWHDWDEDGDELAGTFLRVGRGHTVNGPRTFVVLDVGDGLEKTLWLHHLVLAAAFSREVQRRPSKRIEVGELIQVRRLGEREGGNGRTYTNYRVEFPDGPEVSQVDVFGLPPELAGQTAEPADEPTGEGQGGPDDDVPF